MTNSCHVSAWVIQCWGFVGIGTGPSFSSSSILWLVLQQYGMLIWLNSRLKPITQRPRVVLGLPHLKYPARGRATTAMSWLFPGGTFMRIFKLADSCWPFFFFDQKINKHFYTLWWSIECLVEIFKFNNYKDTMTCRGDKQMANRFKHINSPHYHSQVL